MRHMIKRFRLVVIAMALAVASGAAMGQTVTVPPALQAALTAAQADLTNVTALAALETAMRDAVTADPTNAAALTKAAVEMVPGAATTITSGAVNGKPSAAAALATIAAKANPSAVAAIATTAALANLTAAEDIGKAMTAGLPGITVTVTVKTGLLEVKVEKNGQTSTMTTPISIAGEDTGATAPPRTTPRTTTDTDNIVNTIGDGGGGTGGVSQQ